MCNDLAVIHASYPSCRIDRKGKEMKKMEGRGEKEKEEMKSEEGRKKRSIVDEIVSIVDEKIM